MPLYASKIAVWTIAPSLGLEEFTVFVAMSVSMKIWFHASTCEVEGISPGAVHPTLACPSIATKPAINIRRVLVMTSSPDGLQATRTMECGKTGPQGERPAGSPASPDRLGAAHGVRYCPSQRPWRHSHPGRSPSCCGRGQTATTARLNG